jgi:hypothetical protein
MADKVQIEFGAKYDAAIDGIEAVKTGFDGLGNSATEVRAKLMGAQAELKALKQWAQEASQAVANAGPIAGAGMQNLLDGLSQLGAKEAEVTALQGQFNAVTTESAAALRGMHGSMSQGVFEFRALFDELSSGRASRSPGTLALIAQRVFGLSSSALIGAIGVGVLVAGIGYLAYRAIEADREIDHLKEQFDLLGHGASVTRGYLAAEVAELSALSRGSRATAMAILEAEAAHARMSLTTQDEINQVMPKFIEAFGDKAPEAAKRLIAALSDLTVSGFRRLDEEMLNLPPAQYEVIEGLIRSGHQAEATRLILGRLNGVPLDTLAGHIAALRKEIEGAKVDAEQMALAVTLVPELGGGVGPQAAAIQHLIDLQNKLADLQKEAAKQGAQDKDNTEKQRYDDAEKTNEALNQRAGILAKIAEFQAGLDGAKSTGNVLEIGAFTEAIGIETKKLQDMAHREAEETYRAFKTGEDAKIDAAKGGSAARIAILRDEMAKARELGLTNEANEAQGRISSAQREGVEQGARAAHQAMEQQLGDLRAVAEEAQRGSDARIAADRRWLAAAIAAGAQYHDQARAAEEALTGDLKAQAQQRLQIRQIDAAAAISVSKISLQAERDALDAEVAAGKITASQKVATLEQLAQQEHQLDLRALDDQLATLQQGSAAYERVHDQILVLNARLQAQLNALARQGAVARRREIEKEATAWRGVVREIDSAEAGMVRQVLSGRETLGQGLLQMAGQLVEQEIALDLKWLTNKLLIDALGLQSDKITGQEGLVVHLLTETEKTTATVTGVAARNTAETAGNATSIIGMLTNALKAIGVDAAQTFGGVFAFLAPEMGPAAAAGPATAASAAVLAAAGSVAAFDVGAWEIPHAMLGILHPGETVMPASFASHFRAATGGGVSADAGAGATYNVTMAPQIAAMNSKDVLTALRNPSVMRGLASSLQSYLAANPSVRGKY